MTQETTKKHEHTYSVVRIFELSNFDFVVCKLECNDCGDIQWDQAFRVEGDEF